MSRLLEVLPVPAGPAVLSVLPALERALSGRGPALLPVAESEAPSPEMAAGQPLATDEDDEADPTAVVVSTSGSTGAAKGSLLPVSALRASADGTNQRLGGPGTWLLALPAHHVAGLQVLLRAVQAGTTVTVLDPRNGFDPRAFARAASTMAGGRRFVSLVPTQLARLLDAGEEAIAALASFQAVLVGAAATPADLLNRARRAGVAVVTTYGMSETCGGCVYDGRPLSGVSADLEPDERIVLSGAVVARGYRNQPQATAAAFRPGPREGRSFRTDDRGAMASGRLRVLGRMDDVVITGGFKVEPRVVADALTALPGVHAAVAFGLDDETWGQRVVAAIEPDPGLTAPGLGELRERLRGLLPAHALPRQVVVVEHLPLKGPGKPDVERLKEIARADGQPRSD